MKPHRRYFSFRFLPVCIAIFLVANATVFATTGTAKPLTAIVPNANESLLQRGSDAATKDDFDTAISLFQKALTDAKSSSTQEMATTLLAQTLAARAENLPKNSPARASDLHDAITQLRAFDTQFPKSTFSPANDFALGKAQLANRDLAAAEKTFLKVANGHPENQFSQIAYFQLVGIYERKNNTDAIERVMQDFLARYPQSDKIYLARFNLVNVEIARKEYNLALSSLAKLLSDTKAPIDLRARAMLLGGKIEETRGDRNRAIDYYMKTALLFCGTPETASEALWRAAQLFERQASSLTANSKLTRAAQLTKAVDAYRSLVKNYPHSPHAVEANARLQILTKSK